MKKTLITILLLNFCFFSAFSVKAEYELEREDIYDYKEFFDDLYPIEEENGDNYNQNACTTSSYMWPIGSDEVTTKNGKKFATGEPNTKTITSYFGSTEAGIHDNGHGALDIAPAADAGVVNVIAAIGGEVVYVATGCVSFEGLGSSCGGGYGNHVVIKSADGNYEYYAHMHQNTVEVAIGDQVEQGQVIGKVGSSGRSTGTHLHFEMREGEDSRANRVDPLNYVDPNNPRPGGEGSEGSEDCTMPQDFIDWIAYMEGGPTEGDNYIAVDIGDGAGWTIGHGLTHYVDWAFEAVGVDSSSIYTGARRPISEIDKVFVYVLQKKREELEETVASKNLTMNNNQILSLVAASYNSPALAADIISSYETNGNTYKVYDAYCLFVNSNGYPWPGLIKRRKVEWILFTDGIYVPFDKQSDDGNSKCVGNFNYPSENQSSISSILKETSTNYNGSISYY